MVNIRGIMKSLLNTICNGKEISMTIKRLLTLIILLLFLTACNIGYQVDYKPDDDRKDFTVDEIHSVEKEVLSMAGVDSFSINYTEVGVHAQLAVSETSDLDSIIKETFYSMKRETIDAVDLFVRSESDGKMLAQVFKPEGSDMDDVWTVLYE